MAEETTTVQTTGPTAETQEKTFTKATLFPVLRKI